VAEIGKIVLVSQWRLAAESDDSPMSPVPFSLEISGKILLFDFDGTIVATEGLAKDVIAEYFFPSPFAAQLSEMITGRTWKAACETMVRFARSNGLEVVDGSVLVDVFKTRYRARFEEGVKLIPGFIEMVPQMKALARSLVIVTGSERDEVESILNAHGLSKYFDRIWASGDYEHSKPDPSPFLTAMKDLKCTAAECLVFEDSKAGIESATRAKLSFVQVTHESHPIEADPRALLVIHQWNDLKSLI
jgi:beta-phosphoglucomutase